MTPPPKEPILEVAGVTLRFGGVTALDSVSFSVLPHEVYAIVGPNGGGKSSMLNVLNGFYRPQEGSVVVAGVSVVGRPPHTMAKKGIGRTFQNMHLFAGMSVLMNLMTARGVHMKSGIFRAAFRPLGIREEARHRQVVEEVIDFVGLQEYRHAPVESLGYGVRKRVDLARALCLQPKLLLLDEPLAGMTLEEREDIARLVLDVRAERGVTVVMVEHDMGVVTDICDRALVLDWGKKIAEGAPQQVLARPEVIAAYLGGSAEDEEPSPEEPTRRTVVGTS
ncbi:ABC transporter ATP-binding protein [Acrocarpospora pleiomorpha]|uniref:ABC transporter ATP-binding protein n=1 Tax=Acrocarpospora pleiomorpha TaxID=90975 RepID=A0A5M3XDN6_9ACTN|nr:ABC transporter ATP-binding protein [Acrocarpospora pleiomorpha]GES19374.1 ABC transporter ATP-binding protein [Acrocarpospora pleiomorpha]